jgi:hypothetical protein
VLNIRPGIRGTQPQSSQLGHGHESAFIDCELITIHPTLPAVGIGWDEWTRIECALHAREDFIDCELITIHPTLRAVGIGWDEWTRIECALHAREDFPHLGNGFLFGCHRPEHARKLRIVSVFTRGTRIRAHPTSFRATQTRLLLHMARIA